jgi:hypothetical protein
MSPHVDNEKVKKTVSLVLDKIATDVDLLTLGEYHKIFKKEVPFFRRSWAAAYLLMLCDQGKSLRVSGTEKPAPRKAWNDRPAGGGPKETVSDTGGPAVRNDDSQRYFLTEEESKRLFFSVGRSRRVYPREILGLINAKTAIAREDIGAIRILDNYSFVQVRDIVAEKIIEALNGVTFRGRTLAVNYAKFRKEEENGGGENGNVSVPASAVPASAVPASAAQDSEAGTAEEELETGSPESEQNAETN